MNGAELANSIGDAGDNEEKSTLLIKNRVGSYLAVEVFDNHSMDNDSKDNSIQK